MDWMDTVCEFSLSPALCLKKVDDANITNHQGDAGHGHAQLTGVVRMETPARLPQFRPQRGCKECLGRDWQLIRDATAEPVDCVQTNGSRMQRQLL